MNRIIATIVLILTALVGTVAPANADEPCPVDYSCSSEVTEMGTTVSQVYVGPAPAPIVYGETTTANDYRVQQLEATVARLERRVERQAAIIARLRERLQNRR